MCVFFFFNCLLLRIITAMQADSFRCAVQYSVDLVTPHTGVEMHYDGCNISWILMLSRPSDYKGGGTYIRSLKKTILLEQGQVLVFPGDLFHMGVEITQGTRYLVVCFVDGFDPEIQDPSKAKMDHKKFQKNTLRFFS